MDSASWHNIISILSEAAATLALRGCPEMGDKVMQVSFWVCELRENSALPPFHLLPSPPQAKAAATQPAERIKQPPAYMLGRSSYEQGVPRSSNPFSGNSEPLKQSDWNLGWDHAWCDDETEIPQEEVK